MNIHMIQYMKKEQMEDEDIPSMALNKILYSYRFGAKTTINAFYSQSLYCQEGKYEIQVKK